MPHLTLEKSACYNKAMENTEKIKTGKTVAFLTLGCKVNQYDSDAMRSLFLRRGYTAADGDDADVYVINTCSVTSIGDKKSRQVIRRIRRAHPEAVIAAAGCYAQLAPEEVLGTGCDVVVGNQNRAHIVDYIEEAAAKKEQLNKVVDIMAVKEFENLTAGPEGEVKTRAFIKVQEGCDNYCTFCVIPFARGRLKSRRQEDAVKEAAELARRGYKEIVLTGIHLGNYGKDLHDGTSLSTLVDALLAIPGLARIRLGSIESVELSPELIRIIKTEPRVCAHLHLPLQSGSDTVLRRMNRHYRLQDFKHLITGLRREIPDLALTTDLIVGFPGETEALFLETLDTLRDIRFSGIHVFPYSPRTGTPAASYPDQVPGPVKKDRVHRVEELEKGIAREYRQSFLGKTVRVLAEEVKDGLYEGLSDEYIRVSIEGRDIKRGHLYEVRVRALTDGGLIGTAEEEI